MIEQENNKLCKEGIKRLQNKKTAKAGASDDLLHKEINETIIHWAR